MQKLRPFGSRRQDSGFVPSRLAVSVFRVPGLEAVFCANGARGDRVTRMFGWILKTDWDINRVMRWYSRRHVRPRATCRQC